MKATIGIECRLFKPFKGYYSNSMRRLLGPGRPSKPWVAEITGTCSLWGLARSFVRPYRDYSQASRNGESGVYNWYVLESGRFYEISERISWDEVDRRFAIVTDDGDIERVGREEVEAWAKQA